MTVSGVDPTRIATQPPPERRRNWDRPLPYILLAPAALVLVTVAVYPLYQAVSASFTTYVYGRPGPFAGLKNYENVFQDPLFWNSIGVTATFVALAVLAETVLGLALALLMVSQVRLAKTLRFLILIPMTLAPVIVGMVWRLMYSSDVGAVAPLFRFFGLPDPQVLAQPGAAFVGLVIVDVWEWTPMLFLICLAGLQAVPQDPIEAAKVDGAGPVRIFVQHTLPMLAPVLIVGVVLRVIDAIGTFDQVYVLTRGGPGTATQLIGYYGFNTAINFNQYGQGIAMFLMVAVMVFVLLALVVRRMGIGRKKP
jgi:multiple sugar transport system permease protein